MAGNLPVCIHTMTTKPLALAEAVEAYTRAGAEGITVWRQHIEPLGPEEASRILRDSGLQVVSLCRGGFFPALTEKGRQSAIDHNRQAIDEAAAIGAPLVVLVCGAVPGMPLEEGRKQVADGIAAVLPHALECGVKLAIEPLHPMYADSRSAVNTLKQANDMAHEINHPNLGVAIDVYHVWWDPDLYIEIERCGSHILAFHICDWRTPTHDILNDRALPGDGCIPIRKIHDAVRAAGFKGMTEVEIFSEELWATDQNKLAQRCVDSARSALT